MCRTCVLPSSSTVTSIGLLATVARSTATGCGHANHTSAAKPNAVAAAHDARLARTLGMISVPRLENCDKIEPIDALTHDQSREQSRHNHDPAGKRVAGVFHDQAAAHHLPGDLDLQ